MVPAVADPIPDNVLLQPFIGEARRFDGSTAPPNWMFAQGQTLKVAENRPLFSVLGRTAGGDGKTTFMLPNAKFGMIVAVGGQLVTSPSALAMSSRHMTAKDSLGGGTPRFPPMPPQPSRQTIAERRLISATPRSRARVVPVPQELSDRISGAEQSARSAAIAALSPANQARLDGAVRAVVDGRLDLHDAVTQMASALSGAEADALVQINDGFIRQFNALWGGNQRQQMQYDAAQFLYSLAITHEQAHHMYRQRRRRG